MGFLSAFSRRLYLRIWLAVVAGVAVLTLLVGWAWRVAADYNTPPPLRARFWCATPPAS
jgi:two-component system OmpR family sensor kinase